MPPSGIKSGRNSRLGTLYKDQAAWRKHIVQKFIYTLTPIAFGVLMATSAYGADAKFAATYDTDPTMVEVNVTGDMNTPNSATMVGAEAELATIHVANWKELLVGVSAQVNLVTITKSKGKNNGGTSTSIAEGTVRTGVLVAPEGTADCAAAWTAYDADPANNSFAAPGPVTFASRRQELSVDVQLDVVGAIPEVCDSECIAQYLGIDGSVTVALGLDTTAAHHFNFVAADLTQGTYDVVACYDFSALAEVSGGDIDADTSAYSKAALGPRIVTVQEVRATKTGIIDESGSLQ
jgi:hypothetical protein